MNRYATISVPEDVKQRLQRVKGKKEWGQFLNELLEEVDAERRRRAFARLLELLTP